MCKLSEPNHLRSLNTFWRGKSADISLSREHALGNGDKCKFLEREKSANFPLQKVFKDLMVVWFGQFALGI